MLTAYERTCFSSCKLLHTNVMLKIAVDLSMIINVTAEVRSLSSHLDTVVHKNSATSG